MNLRERQQRLDALLLATRTLWQPQPFRELRPAWCARWPALTAALLALSDAAAVELNDNAAAAINLLATHVPEVAELLSLTTVAARPVAELAAHNPRWAWEIPGRKRQQIEAFAAAARPAGASVLDWCGGKGHLGRLLALEWGRSVHTLEIDAALCADGAGLAERLAIDHKFAQQDALTAAEWPQAGQHAVALHACGELHRRLIEQGAECGVSRFDVAPCCYYRGVEQVYRPLSAGLRLSLNRDDTRLAVTETVTASPRLARQRDKEMAWKLAFAAWRQQVTGGAYQRFKPVPAAWFRAGFAEFMQLMAGREKLCSALSANVDGLESIGWQRQREVMRLSVVRHAFRRALEIWLVLDLAVYLESRGYAVEFGTFCPRQLTPRNLLISAQRAA